jgi:hypothetical protein
MVATTKFSVGGLVISRYNEKVSDLPPNALSPSSAVCDEENREI